MIKCSPDFVTQYFGQRYQRGAVVRFNMEGDDPHRPNRFKYGVVLNLDSSEDEALLALATSRIDRFASSRFDPDVLRLPANRYDWTTQDTIVDLRSIRIEIVSDLKSLCENGEMRFEDPLNAADIADLDRKLRASRLLQLRLKKRVVN